MHSQHVEPTLEAILTHLPAGSFATLFHIQGVQIEVTMLGHLNALGTGLRGEIQLWGTPAGGAPSISRGKIIFQDDTLPASRPVLDAAREEVTVYARISQAPLFISQLRGSSRLMLIYYESPSVDQVGATVLSYDSFLLTEKVP